MGLFWLQSMPYLFRTLGIVSPDTWQLTVERQATAMLTARANVFVLMLIRLGYGSVKINYHVEPNLLVG